MKRVYSELKRRNVLRMAALYGVAAWLVMQVAEVLMGLASLPAWSGRLLLTLLAIGFPIALILSWFYELTPEGISLEKDVPHGESITHITGRRLDFLVIAVLSAGLLVFAYDKWWQAGPSEYSIAVLPFQNLSGDPEQEYFSDGISEEVLNVLAQVEPLTVIARTSSFSYKNKAVDIPTVAKELNVRHVLEGSVRRSGDQVRITVQLVDGRNSTPLWSHAYNRQLTTTNLFAVQADIARAITEQLRLELTQDQVRRLDTIPTQNLDAYSAYLLGRHRLTDRTVTGLADAVAQFARAVEIDPNYAAAYSGLVDACFLYRVYTAGQTHDRCPASQQELEALARKAVTLDEGLGEAWVSLGKILEDGEAPPEQVQAAFERGLALNPSHTQGHHWYAMFLGGIEQRSLAYQIANEGLNVDPLSVPLHYLVSGMAENRADFDKARWHARRIIDIAPDSPRGYERLGEIHAGVDGRFDAFIHEVLQAARIDPRNPGFYREAGLGYLALEDHGTALAYFEAGAERSGPSEAAEYIAMTAMPLLYEGRINEARQRLQDFLGAGQLEGWKSGYALWVLAGLDLSAGDAAQALDRYRTYWPMCFDAEPPEWCWVGDIARVLQSLGETDHAERLLESSWSKFQAYIDRRGERWRLGWHADGIADVRLLAMLGRRSEALDALEDAVQQGYRGLGGFWYPLGWQYDARFDASLDSIRGDPRFEAAFAVIEADMARQLESVRAMERSGEIPTLEELRALRRK